MKLGDQKQLESVRGKKSNKYSENWSATIGFPRDNRIMEEIWLQNKKESSDKERDEYSTEKKDKIDGNITLLRRTRYNIQYQKIAFVLQTLKEKL